MLRWALVFLVLTLAFGLFWMLGIAGMQSQVARLLLVVFLLLFVLSLLLGGAGRARDVA